MSDEMINIIVGVETPTYQLPPKSENEWILEAGSKLLIKSRKGKIIAELIR